MFMTWHDDVDYVGYIHNYLSPTCNTMGKYHGFPKRWAHW
jgi:hypothetical protein